MEEYYELLLTSRPQKWLMYVLYLYSYLFKNSNAKQKITKLIVLRICV